MSSLTVGLFHIFGLLESIFALGTYYYYVIGTIDQGFGGPWKFLTFLNMWIQIICFLLCLLCDVIEVCQQEDVYRTIKKFRDMFYASIGLPSCVNVFVTFWVLYVVDRNVIHPEHLDEIIPPWANHMWHTAILILVLDIGFTKYTFPSRTKGIITTSLFGLGYLTWILYVQYFGGFYVYPFLALFNTFQFVMFVLVDLMFMWGVYIAGENLNRLAGKENEEKKKI